MTTSSEPLPIELAYGLRRRLLQTGPPLTTLFVKLANVEVMELVAQAGFDLAIIDFEHSQLSEGEVRRLLTHAAAIGLPAVVRLPDVDRGTINRFLEAGAVGLQLSMTTRRKQAEDLISLTRYAPQGTRSIHLGHSGAGHGRVALPAYLDRVAGGPLVIVQIETAQTETPLPDLLAGVDIAFCGVTDMSVDMGVPGQLMHPLVVERVGEIARVARELDQPASLGLFVSDSAAVPTAVDMGARFVAVGSDMALLSAAMKRSMAGVGR